EGPKSGETRKWGAGFLAGRTWRSTSKRPAIYLSTSMTSLLTLCKCAVAARRGAHRRGFVGDRCARQMLGELAAQLFCFLPARGVLWPHPSLSARLVPN